MLRWFCVKQEIVRQQKNSMNNFVPCICIVLRVVKTGTRKKVKTNQTIKICDNFIPDVIELSLVLSITPPLSIAVVQLFPIVPIVVVNIW